MKSSEAKVWLDFALRDLRAAEVLYGEGDVPNALYHLQQAAEKSLKAIIIYYAIPTTLRQFRTHNLEHLVGVLERYGAEVPEALQGIELLSDYAFSTRYPDDYVPVSKEEYEEAYEIAKKVLEWAKSIVQP
ncbi:MAG: HEPN domain-containing protein [Thermotogae bacterium]|nr:HEPN domain-containing protein [Thermotogota bacterium]